MLACAWDDANFLDWFEDELREQVNAPLVFEGKVPSYITGVFVQTGPARFHFGEMKFTHMLDGYSKTNTVRFLKDGTANFTTEFLASEFLNESIQGKGISRGMFVGSVEPSPLWGPTAVAAPNDNNYIKMRKVGDQHLLLSDTMIVTEVQGDCVSFQSNLRSKLLEVFNRGLDWQDSLEPLGDLCMLGTMAHADEDPVTGIFTGAMGCFGLSGNYHMVFTIDPSSITTRKLLAKIPLLLGRGPSYMHTLAATPNFIVLIADPLYLSVTDMMEGAPLGKGGLQTNGDPTLFQVVDRKTGAVRTFENPGFIHAHILNSWEEGDDILIDLTWYDANNKTTLGWMNRWFLEYIKDPTTREQWPRSKVMRYRLKADGSVETQVLFADEDGENDFEVPKINEKLNGHPYCMVYATQFHSYEYDFDQQATKGGPFGAVGLAKRNLCSGERGGRYVPNTYPSEVQFVADPGGIKEDDGVLLGIVFDGNTNSSSFHILDAHNLELVAKAELPVKIPFLIHASYFPEENAPIHITV